jgi:hypothetical protein
MIFACGEVKHKLRRVKLEDYLTYRHRVMLVKFGTRVRVSHTTVVSKRMRRIKPQI